MTCDILYTTFRILTISNYFHLEFAEPAAIDLLAHALSGTSGAGSLPTGVEVVSDENNVKGYR